MANDLRPAFKLLILLFILFILGTVSALGSGGEMNLDQYGPRMITLMKIVQVIAVLLIFVLPAGLFSLLFTKEKLRYPRLHVSPAFSLLLIAILVFIIGMPMIAWLEQWNRQMTLPASLSGLEKWMQRSEANAGKITEAFLADTSMWGLALNLFVIAFMAAFSEELFFRGALQQVFAEVTKNYHAAVWITAALFSAFHLQFYGFVPRMIMGVVLGYLFVWSGSLWVNIIAHFVNNGTAVVLAWLSKRGVISSDLENGVTDVPAAWGIVSMAVVVVLMALAYRVRKKEKPGNAETTEQLTSA